MLMILISKGFKMPLKAKEVQNACWNIIVVVTMTSDSKYILGIMVSAAAEKWQLKIEGGGGQRTYF